jgi:hypothetical protein
MLLSLALAALVLQPAYLPERTYAALSGQARDADELVAAGTSRAWALLACSVLFERNGSSHDLLAGGKRSPEAVAAAKSLLEKDWDITKAGDLLEQLEWLEHRGHRAEFEKDFRELRGLTEKQVDDRVARFPDVGDREVVKARWRNAPRAAKLKGGLVGWDLARYVALCRWGYAAEYLSETEAWKQMNNVVNDLQKAYKSWDELGEAYCIGRDCWRPGTNKETVDAFERLKSAENSPWKSTPWNLKLAPLDKVQKPVPPRTK